MSETAVILRFPVPHHRITYRELGGCSRCGGWEGEVPTDCPGELMTEEQRWAVLEERLDFLHREGWTTETRRMRNIRKMICEEGYPT